MSYADLALPGLFPAVSLGGGTVSGMGEAGDPTYWVRRACFHRESVGSGVLVLPVGGEEPLALDGAASIVWTLLDRPLTTDGLRSELVDVLGLDSTTVDGHLTATLSMLNDKNLIGPAVG